MKDNVFHSHWMTIACILRVNLPSTNFHSFFLHAIHPQSRNQISVGKFVSCYMCNLVYDKSKV